MWYADLDRQSFLTGRGLTQLQANISNTAILNLETKQDIKTQLGGLSSSQWAWCLSIF